MCFSLGCFFGVGFMLIFGVLGTRSGDMPEGAVCWRDTVSEPFGKGCGLCCSSLNGRQCFVYASMRHNLHSSEPPTNAVGLAAHTARHKTADSRKNVPEWQRPAVI